VPSANRTGIVALGRSVGHAPRGGDGQSLAEPVLAMADQWYESELVIRLLAGRWTLALLGQLATGGRRYQDLHAALDGISHKVLTDTLRRAERDGLVFRQVDHNRIETTTLYLRTDLGCSLEEPLTALAAWAERNWTEVQAARRGWDQRSDQ
jgi:DNA-binding HxlR family transcriptional regulator